MAQRGAAEGTRWAVDRPAGAAASGARWCRFAGSRRTEDGVLVQSSPVGLNGRTPTSSIAAEGGYAIAATHAAVVEINA